jgi:hypothetical protein
MITQTRRATQLRRTSRLTTRFNRALAAMRSGQSLQLQHHEGRPRWSLSNGQSVAHPPRGGCPHHPKCVRPHRPATLCSPTCRVEAVK